MLQFITPDTQWDTYTLVAVIVYHLSPENDSDVFAATIGSSEYDFTAKYLFNRLVRTSHARTMRAHLKPPSEMQVW